MGIQANGYRIGGRADFKGCVRGGGSLLGHDQPTCTPGAVMPAQHVARTRPEHS